MFNLIRNIIFLGLLFFISFSLSLFVQILFNISDNLIFETFKMSDTIITSIIFTSYNQFKILFINGVYILISLLVFLTLISSLINSNNFVGYIISIVSGLILTPIVIYIIAEFWNRYLIFGISLNDFVSAFAENFLKILILNLIFGALSFVFVKKSSIE